MKLLKTLLIVAFSGVVFSASGQHYPYNPEAEPSMAPIVIPPLPAQLDFAGERVPLENYDTRESLVRDLMVTCYMHSRTMHSLLATTRYFPIIEPILKQYGIPDDFKYLCMAESGLNPNVRSSAGAGGLWQFMPATGKEFGLFIGTGVDERYNVEKSTEAACKYLLGAKARLGSWTLAAASYNVGIAGITTRQEKQGITDYYDLYLPDETMRYIFRCLTFKLVMADPEAYGFFIAPGEYNKPLTDYRVIQVNSAQIDWSAVARENGTTYKMLRELNHWIRDYTYNNSGGRTFTIKIPNKEFRN